MSLRSAAARLTGFSGRKPQLDAALQEEIRAHIELETQENVERGVPPAAARRAALLAFGIPTLAHEDTTAMWTVRAVESFLQDVRFGLRLLLKTPLLTIVALLSLTLGIGVTTATFILVNAGILRAFPFPEPRQLFRIEMARRSGVGNSGISQAVLQHWRSQPTSFSAIGAYRGNSVVVQSEQGAESVLSAAVAGDFF